MGNNSKANQGRGTLTSRKVNADGTVSKTYSGGTPSAPSGSLAGGSSGNTYGYEGADGKIIPYRNDEQAAMGGYYGDKAQSEISDVYMKAINGGSAVSSSSGARKAVEGYQKQLKGINQKLATYQNDLKASKAEKEMMQRQQQAQIELARAKKGETFREDYDMAEQETDGLDNPTTDTYRKVQEYKASQEQDIDAQTNKYLRELKNFGATLDDDNNFLLDSIADTFNQRRAEAQETGKRQVAGLVSQGLRSGQTRYANEIQTGIVSAAEQNVIQKIAQIDSEEKKSIVEANKAFTDGKFKLFTEQMKLVQDSQKEKGNLVQELYDNSVKYDNQLLQARQEDRLSQKDELDRQEQTAKMLALSVFTEGGGKDVIEKYAQEYGIDPMYLSSYVQQEKIEANKRYQDAIKAGKSNVISAKDAFSMGLPSSVVGLSEDEVYTDLTSSLPPKWFIDIQNATAGDNGVGMSLNPEATLQNWNEYRNANYDAGEPTPDLGVKQKGDSLESQIENLF